MRKSYAINKQDLRFIIYLFDFYKMEAYKPYVDYIVAGGVAETAYILTKEGVICATNLPIQALPQYNFELEDENDPAKKHPIVVDERVNLLEAIGNNGVSKHK